jgi:hypothetical protein
MEWLYLLIIFIFLLFVIPFNINFIVIDNYGYMNIKVLFISLNIFKFNLIKQIVNLKKEQTTKKSNLIKYFLKHIKITDIAININKNGKIIIDEVSYIYLYNILNYIIRKPFKIVNNFSFKMNENHAFFVIDIKLKLSIVKTLLIVIGGIYEQSSNRRIIKNIVD